MPEDLAPNYILNIAGTDLGTGLTKYVQSVTYESTDGIADMAKIVIANPNLVFQDLKVFKPGNEISIHMGYGTTLEHVGRVVIVKPRPTFPEAVLPTMEIVGYTKDFKMMDNAPEGSKKKGGKGGRSFPGEGVSDVVTGKAEFYGFEADIDDAPQIDAKLFQKVGLSDYQFVKGLANMTGFFFWVDGDEDGKWTLHFKDPSKSLTQEKEFTFNYNTGNRALLSFTPEFLISGANTKIKVRVKDEKTGKVIEEEIEEDEDPPDATWTGTADEEVAEGRGSTVKLFIGDFSFEEFTNKRFKKPADVKAWAEQWFRRMRENLITGGGRVIGVESLRARQIHTLDGLGTEFDGRWFFSRVRHTMESGGGYTVEFNGRKSLA
jgi:phage protein D